MLKLCNGAFLGLLGISPGQESILTRPRPETLRLLLLLCVLLLLPLPRSSMGLVLCVRVAPRPLLGFLSASEPLFAAALPAIRTNNSESLRDVL